jgi:hypothetical protein
LIYARARQQKLEAWLDVWRWKLQVILPSKKRTDPELQYFGEGVASMMKKLLFGFTTVAVLAASAASYNVSFSQDAQINGKALKAGDYKLELKDNNTAVLKRNKDLIEVPAHVETGERKFSNTMIRMGKDGDVQAISLRGTTTRVVFGTAGSAAGNVQ